MQQYFHLISVYPQLAHSTPYYGLVHFILAPGVVNAINIQQSEFTAGVITAKWTMNGTQMHGPITKYLVNVGIIDELVLVMYLYCFIYHHHTEAGSYYHVRIVG